MKKLFVLLLCLLAVVAIISCKQDPKTEPEKKPGTQPIASGTAYCYRLTATRDAKRFALRFIGAKEGSEGINPEAGSVLTFQYRSSHPVTHLYLRNEKGDSVPEFAKKTSITPYISEPDEDGWITFTFTYPADMAEGTYPVSGFLLELANYTDGSHADGKGMFVTGDYLEIMDLMFDGVELGIDGPENATDAVRYQTDNGVYNNSSETNKDHCWPVFEVKYL